MKLYSDLSALVISDLAKTFERINGKCKIPELFQVLFLIVLNCVLVEMY